MKGIQFSDLYRRLFDSFMSLAVHWAAFKVQIEDNELKTYKSNNKSGEQLQPAWFMLH